MLIGLNRTAVGPRRAAPAARQRCGTLRLEISAKLCDWNGAAPNERARGNACRRNERSMWER